MTQEASSSESRSGRGERVAVLIPCFNEAVAIGSVVKQFSDAIPGAAIYVYDNNSSDSTAQTAEAAGAVVRREPLQGKGNVVRRMFSDVDADLYVMVDGDGTYDATAAPDLIRLLKQNDLAMVVGKRVHQDAEAYRPGHVLGNRMFTGAIQWIFGKSFEDILSGYRVFSRRFVKSFPGFSRGFEIETELTVHALTLRLPTMELNTRYYARPEGSQSKLNTIRDGWTISLLILRLVKDERPLFFYSIIGTLLNLIAVVLAIPIFIEFLETSLVPRFPTAILSTGLAVSGLMSYGCGLILDSVALARREMRFLHYLNMETSTFE